MQQNSPPVGHGVKVYIDESKLPKDNPQVSELIELKESMVVGHKLTENLEFKEYPTPLPSPVPLQNIEQVLHATEQPEGVPFERPAPLVPAPLQPAHIDQPRNDIPQFDEGPPDLLQDAPIQVNVERNVDMENGEVIVHNQRIGGLDGNMLPGMQFPTYIHSNGNMAKLRLGDFSVCVDPKSGLPGLLLAACHRVIMTSNDLVQTVFELKSKILNNQALSLVTLGTSCALDNLANLFLNKSRDMLLSGADKVVNLMDKSSNASDAHIRAVNYFDSKIPWEAIVCERGHCVVNGSVTQRDPAYALIPLVKGSLLIAQFHIMKLGGYTGKEEYVVLAAPAVVRWCVTKYASSREAFKANCSFAIRATMSQFNIPAWLLDSLTKGTEVISDLWHLKLSNEYSKLKPLNF